MHEKYKFLNEVGILLASYQSQFRILNQQKLNCCNDNVGFELLQIDSVVGEKRDNIVPLLLVEHQFVVTDYEIFKETNVAVVAAVASLNVEPLEQPRGSRNGPHMLPAFERSRSEVAEQPANFSFFRLLPVNLGRFRGQFLRFAQRLQLRLLLGSDRPNVFY